MQHYRNMSERMSFKYDPRLSSIANNIWVYIEDTLYRHISFVFMYLFFDMANECVLLHAEEDSRGFSLGKAALSEISMCGLLRFAIFRNRHGAVSYWFVEILMIIVGSSVSASWIVRLLILFHPHKLRCIKEFSLPHIYK